MNFGIDFGTCNSCAALNVKGKLKKVPEPLRLGSGFPSSVFLTKEKKILIGEAAENNRLIAPSNYRREFKRELGRKDPLLLGDKSYLPENLIGFILKGIREEAAKLIGTQDPLSQIVLTVPATYTGFKKDLMRQAANEAGLKQVILLEEPVAAAIYYAHESSSNTLVEGDIALVFDLGGGTFDAALIQKQENKYEIIAQPLGESHLGGIDFDRLIYQDLEQRCSPELRELLNAKRSDLESRRARLTIGDICRDLKHQISVAMEHEVFLPIGSTEVYSLTRAAFEQMIAPLVQKTLILCNQLIKDADLNWSQICQILLVGGSCRIPYIQKTLEQEFGRPVLRVDEPELAVALGAAIFSGPDPSPMPEPPNLAPLEALKSSIVRLRDLKGNGTGFIISDCGHILTCNHVVQTEEIQVIFASGDSALAKVLGRDHDHDLALLQVDKQTPQFLCFADPTIMEGETVFALGYPLDLDLSLSKGIVSNRHLVRNGTSFLQTDASINPGNSGGPIVNSQGEVLGVASFFIANSQGISLSIALRHIFSFAAQQRLQVRRRSVLNDL